MKHRFVIIGALGERMTSFFDETDARILTSLQKDGRLSTAELAAKVRLTASPTWRRVKRLEAAGVIAGYGANLNRRALGWGVLTFVTVKIGSHNEAEAHAFESAVGKLPQVVACWSIAGSADFLLQVVERDLDSYGEFAMTTIRRLPGIRSMQTIFTLKDVKQQGPWPISETLEMERDADPATQL
jgi:Lrp/AsnC family leucine-responsive transcriptional regulator